jgi:hypothetical protein
MGRRPTRTPRVWNYCNVLRDDGVAYGDYIEQLTYLLFLKMADEGARLPPPLTEPSNLPEEYDWTSLKDLSGDVLEVHYRHVIENLGKAAGLLGVIFRKVQNEIQDPAKLRRLIGLIDTEVWAGGCRPASSTLRASRPTSSSSTNDRAGRSRGRKRSGFTICAPTYTSRSRPTRSARTTCETSSPASTRRTGTTGRRQSVSRASPTTS